MYTLSAEEDEAVLGGEGYSEFFLSLVFALRTEELVQHSRRGKAVEEVLQLILKHSGGASTPDTRNTANTPDPWNTANTPVSMNTANTPAPASENT